MKKANIVFEIVLLVFVVLHFCVGDYEMAMLALVMVELLQIENRIEAKKFSQTDFMRGIQFGMWLVDDKEIAQKIKEYKEENNEV